MTKRSTSRFEAGMTLLEMVVVLIIITGLAYIGAMALSRLSRSKLNDDTTAIAGLARRASQLATETGYMHRLVLDLDNGSYRIEECQGGPAAIEKNPETQRSMSQDEKAAALEEARRKLQSMPQNMMPQAGAGLDEQQGEAMALALAGDLGALRTCKLAIAESGKFDNKELQYPMSGGVKIRQVWVQHLEDPVQSGMVAIHFFPIGSAEKAIIELADDEEAFSILIQGLTGRVEVRDSAVSSPEDFFMRDVNGDKVPES